MELLGMFAAMAAVYGFVGIVGIVLYILQAVALQTIANRRGIAHSWLAWIPVGCVWLIGAIADDYRLKAKGEKKNRRSILLWSSLASLLILAIMFGSIFGVFFKVIELQQEQDDLNIYSSDYWEEYEEYEEEIDDVQDEMESAMVLYFLLFIPLMGLGLLMVVFQYICLYDLYNSCDPDNGAIYLILSIFVSGVAGILLFVCRNKDKGMYRPMQPPYGYPPQYGQPYQQPPYQQPRDPNSRW